MASRPDELKGDVMAEKPKQIQQGDVLLQEVENLPEGSGRIAITGPKIIARGEQTGHNHTIDSDQADLWALSKNGVTEFYLEVRNPVTIVHDEHKSLPIPPGIYRVGRVKEYDYFAEMERQLED
jgi:hypothetical protein